MVPSVPVDLAMVVARQVLGKKSKGGWNRPRAPGADEEEYSTSPRGGGRKTQTRTLSVRQACYSREKGAEDEHGARSKPRPASHFTDVGGGWGGGGPTPNTAAVRWRT